jgi:hypothetical protein
MRGAIAIVLTAVFTLPIPNAKPPPDVPDAYLCNQAVVKVNLDGGLVNVREAPNTSGRLHSQLPNGAIIYACDESGKWYKIRFGRPGSPCDARLTGGIPVAQAAHCESGWVSKRFIEVLSG